MMRASIRWPQCLAALAAGFALSLAPGAMASENSALAPAAAAPSPEQVQTMVSGLGHDSFARREQAMTQLIAAGEAVEKEVLAAVSDGDPEVRYRASKVLREIEKSQIANRRERFIHGEIAALRQNAASWLRFEKIVGNTRATREQFVSMQKEGGALLDSLETDPVRCAGEIGGLYQKMIVERRAFAARDGFKSGQLLAMVFAAGCDEVQLDVGATNRTVSLLTIQARMAENNETLQQLLGRWMGKEGVDVNAQMQFMRLAQQFKMPQALPLARKLMAAAPHPSYKAQALMVVAQFGGVDDVAEIEKSIGDNSSLGVMGAKNERKECKLGDVALGVCISLSGQKASDFGFAGAVEGRPIAVNWMQYGFMKEEGRAAARTKWAEFRKTQTAAKE